MSNVNSKPGVRHQAKITLTLPEDMMSQVKEESGKQAMPVATWIRAALVDYLQNRVSDTKANAC